MTALRPADPELDALHRRLRAEQPGPETLEQTRARLDRRADTVALPTDCEIETATIGEVAVERLTPVTAGKGRALLYFHGGGYQVGSPRSHRYLAARLADIAGCEAVVPEYRLAPEAPFPAALDDALAVYRALLAVRAPESLVIGGDSAGGGLALSLALAARSEGLAQPAGLVLLSPWVDLAHEGSTYDKAEDDTVDLDGLHQAARTYAAGADLHDPRLSPLYGELSGLAPILIQVGTAEALLSDSTRLAERAATAGVETALHAIPGLVHGFSLYFEELTSVRAAYAAAGAWMAAKFA